MRWCVAQQYVFSAFLVMALSLQLHLTGQAQPLGKIVAAYDSSAVETGEAFSLEFRITPAAAHPAVTNLSPWYGVLPKENILACTHWERTEQGWRQALILIFLEAGDVILPPLPVVLLTGDTLWSAPIRLSVIPTPTPEEQASWRDIKALWLTPASWLERWAWLLGIVVGLLMLAIVVYWLLRRPKNRRKVRETVHSKSPHVLAAEQLAVLESQRLWERGALKAYYTELSRIVREYLERQYGFPALESSTEEVLQCAQRAIPSILNDPLKALLQWCDLVKFAQATPPAHYHAQAMREARRLVEQTAAALRSAPSETSSYPSAEPPA